MANHSEKTNKIINVRIYQEGDDQAIVDLLIEGFPEWARMKNSLEHWRWEYLSSPVGSEIVVADTDNKIVAVNHGINLNIKMGQSVLLSQYVTDTTTHKDYRGFGLFGKIVNKAEILRKEKNVRLGLGFSTNPIVIKDWKKRGRPQFPHPVAYMVKIKDVNLHIKKHNFDNSFVIGAGYKTLSNLNKIRSKIKGKPNQVEDFKLIKIDQFTEKIDELWRSVSDSYNFIPEKSSSYMNWRYCDPRAGNFYIKAAISEDKFLGFIVSELRNSEDYSKGVIVELLALPERLDVVDALIEDSCNYFDSLGVNVVYFMVVKGHPYQAISKDCGFVESQENSYISLTIIGSEKEFEVLKASQPSQVYFSSGPII